MDVAEGSPRIPGSIRPPAGNFIVAPPAVSPAGVREHHMVATIGQQLGPRGGRVGSVEFALRWRHLADVHRRRHSLPRGDVMKGRKDRDALVKQRLDRANARVRVETAPDGIAMDKVDEREESHSLMMGHIRPYDQPALAPATWHTGEVHRFVVAVVVQKPQLGQSSQILHALSRRNVHREKRCVGRDDDILLQAALQSELRHAECLVLICLVDVQISKGGFRDPPRHMTLATVGDVDRHRFLRRFVKERVGMSSTGIQGHQIFEHGPRPAEQHAARRPIEP